MPDPYITVSFPAARQYDLPESVLRLLAVYCGPLLPAGGVFHARMLRSVWEGEFVPALRAAGVDLTDPAKAPGQR